MNEPTVSVVIPAYNVADLIGATLDSVLEQTYHDFEIIVVDDGSTDSTREVVATYGEPVRYVRKVNGGSASARNRGIQEARGTYVAFLDADDLWRPTKLEVQMQEHLADPALAWSYTDSYLVDAESGTIIFRRSHVRDRPEGDVLDALLKGNFIAPSTTVVEHRVFDEVGVFDESSLHRISEDWDLWMRIAARYPVRFIGTPLVETRQHADRKTETMDLEHALESRLAIIDKAVQRNPDRLAEVYDEARANLLVNIGRKWMNREERNQARQLFMQALCLEPLLAEGWLYAAGSLIPRKLLRLLGAIRRRTRRDNV